MRVLIAATLLLLSGVAAAQDYEREQRWADQILPALMIGEAVWLQEKEGHKFLTLYTEAKNARGAVILAHGRGWSPDYELYGILRAKIADAGYTTLAIQLPVLGGGAKIGDYIPTYPDARERFQLAADYLKGKGYQNIAIVSHSLGATMANQYLIVTDDKTVKAWVFIGIINGLEEMFRIKIPVLDVSSKWRWSRTTHRCSWSARTSRKTLPVALPSGRVRNRIRRGPSLPARPRGVARLRHAPPRGSRPASPATRSTSKSATNDSSRGSRRSAGSSSPRSVPRRPSRWRRCVRA
jgi:pimeloyl-ACP methyl ester carboxylesterase